MSLNNHYTELTSYLKTEILDPSKIFLEKQNSDGKKIYTDIKKLDKDFRDSLTNLEKHKTKFLNMAKVAETAKLDSELARLSYIPQPEKDKFFSKCNAAIKDAKEAEKSYISALHQANSIRVNYIEGSTFILHSFQVLEEEFMEFNKHVLRKFYIFSNATIKSSLYDTEKAYQKIEEVNLQQDMNDFIESHNTNIFPPLEIEYVPYSILMRNKPIEESTYPSEVFYNVVVTIQSLFEKVANDYVSFYLFSSIPLKKKRKFKFLRFQKSLVKAKILLKTTIKF